MTTDEQYAAEVLSWVIADVRDGHIPASVNSFSDLHDHVDANTYLEILPDLEDGSIDLDLTNRVTDLVDAMIKRHEHGAISGEVSLDLLEDMLGDAAVADVNRGHAGGTTTLWAVVAGSDCVVCLTDEDGPFSGTDEVEVDGFMVGVYADESAYMDGGMPIDDKFLTCGANLADLRDVLITAVQQSFTYAVSIGRVQ
jgi:hypothetical protein